MKPGSIVADPHSILGRLDTLEPLDVTGTRCGEALDRLFDATPEAFIQPGHVR
jgi:hypothetical protein